MRSFGSVFSLQLIELAGFNMDVVLQLPFIFFEVKRALKCPTLRLLRHPHHLLVPSKMLTHPLQPTTVLSKLTKTTSPY